MPTPFENAVALRVEYDRRVRGGDPADRFLLDQVLPAVEAAENAGHSKERIHAAADREYGQWLIDNANR
ncbi:hypothetical protein ACFW2V_02700 [Streptomyces sp. NPDC058947]|uniref:hypothetical protein n=1 Tax=Streptomyces sp. NPDC058947 TaxID=3346675 RepID=UPI0036A8F3A0